jgi:hypothetical protein
MDKKQIRKINKAAATIALTCVVAQELAFAFFLWLAGFDFTTRRPALGLAAGFAAALAIFVFGFTFGALVKLFTLEAVEDSRLPAKMGAPTTKAPTCE